MKPELVFFKAEKRARVDCTENEPGCTEALVRNLIIQYANVSSKLIPFSDFCLNFSQKVRCCRCVVFLSASVYLGGAIENV